MLLSTITIQQVYDKIIVLGDVEPALNVGGYSDQPMLTIATDVMNEMCSQNFPYKWNEFQIPYFTTNQYQQDYAIPGLTSLSSLERGIAVQITANQMPKPWAYVECGRLQTQSTAATMSPYFRSPLYTANWIYNSQGYYATWGAANTGNSTLGQNPQALQVITDPLSGTNPNNPILQIKDANGNLLVLTGYGTLGSTAPVAPAASAAGTVATPGTGDTTTWVVVDPQGQSIRINPVPGPQALVWQFYLIGQLIPPQFTTMSQTLAPLTDEFEPNFRAGCIAQSYFYSPDPKVRAKFETAWQMWLRSLAQFRRRQDKELDEFSFKPGKRIGSGRASTWRGPANPYLYYNY